MKESTNASQQPSPTGNTPPEFDCPARRAGWLLILTAAAFVVMVLARVSADADQPSLLESLRMIAENRAVYTTSAVARILSGITLIAAAWYLLRTWIMRQRLATPWVPYLLGASGAVTGFSGVCALILAISTASGGDVSVSGLTESADFLRWLTGKLGFALGGLAILLAARYQWRVGGALRRIAPASAAIGLGMQFIWVDAATILHPIIGVMFMAWLMVVGAMLATGRTERHFAKLS